MKPKTIVNLVEAEPFGLSIEELERRMELACVEIDPCLGSYCWQFVSEYTCSMECSVQCGPFFGCHPYCHE